MHKLQRTFQVVRSSLFSWMNKEFLIFLFFLVLSGIFWLMMTLNETYEKELPVAVRLTGAPGNVVMTSEMSDTVRVTVRDKGFMILSYMSSNKLKPITLNFNAYANKQSGHGQVPLSDVQRLVRQQLFSSSTITSIKADALTFNFNYGERKTVGVKLIGNIVPTRNYYLSHVQLTPEKVTIFASRSKLDSIKEVQTEYVNITNFDDTVRQMVRIKKIPGVKVVPEKVTLNLREEDGKYTLETNLYELLPEVKAPAVSTELLGAAFEPEEKFENPDGTPIVFNQDYFGRHRAINPMPGPFESAEELQETLF